MKAKGIKEKIIHNARSQLIRREAINYSTYAGSLARNGWDPITCPDWHHVDPIKLDMIWKEMKVSNIFSF